MKRVISLILCFAMCMLLYACGTPQENEQPSGGKNQTLSEKTPEEIAAQNWRNINDGDIYSLNKDGTGTHNKISLTYTVEGDTLLVTEGVASIQTKSFLLDTKNAYPRLIPEGENSFYVTEADYKELAPKVRRENIQILLSCESWKASSMDGYLYFYENGTGKLTAPADNINQAITWEMVDNNTLRAYVPVDSTKRGVNTMDIINDNGQYSLVKDDQSMHYTPHGDSRSQPEADGAVVAIDAGYGYTMCLKEDGTAKAVGNNERNQCDIGRWTDLIAISGANMHTVGLTSDGKVLCVGDNSSGQCEVNKWNDISRVEASYFHTAALKSDGTAVAVGYNESGQCDLQNWSGITALSVGGYHTLGLRDDGTVIATGFNDDGRCNVQEWENIVAISGGGYHSVGLKADGTVVATGQNTDGQCDVETWTDIVAISAGECHTVGLRSDGTVVATGRNGDNQCVVGAWCDIKAISAGGKHTVGLKQDGTVLIIGNNDHGQCDAASLMKAD